MEHVNSSGPDESLELQAARVVIQECFWGDYELTPTEILARLSVDDDAFKRFLFGRIADNASYPSRLIRANLTGDRTLVPERSWSR